MIDQFERTRMMIGEEALSKLNKSTAMVFGIGGVGSFTAEALIRAGVGNIILIDNDTVALTNINRQLIAAHSTVGRYKTEVMKERGIDINPDVNIEIINEFVLYDNINDIMPGKVDYVVDAVDTVTAKLAIIERCKELDIPIVSSMGTGNKLHPEMLQISDIYKTSVCPLAKVMRYELKKRGIKKLKVCYSTEIPITPAESQEETNKRRTPASISFVPSVAGLIIAGEVIRGLIN